MLLKEGSLVATIVSCLSRRTPLETKSASANPSTRSKSLAFVGEDVILTFLLPVLKDLVSHEV